ncbi:SDR family NAD(P)-dependent oxidoreductase [Nocardia sp. NPDC005978]|uniref:SDR family NAD(P)-dependent oxidoreductase n=1 Tax=Nocardia sp. NPDC005978 TaxID=3156725 RepID=UPI0033BB174A
MQSTIVMTGASRGIGRVAAERILAERPGVHLVVLARASSQSQVAELAAGRGSVTHITADLESLDSIRLAVHEIEARLDGGELPPLIGIVANAGIQYTNVLTETPDGFESTFAVNVLANHLLIRLLEPRLRAPGRIVITVSDTHFGDFKHNLGMVPGPVWQTPARLARVGAHPRPETTAAGRIAYSTSKLAAIHLVHEYARRLPAGVDVLAFNPGFVPGTDLARDADPFSRFAMRRVLPALTLTPLANSPKTAGRHLADVVLGKVEAATGSYIDRDRVARSSDESYNREREAELWVAVDQFTFGGNDRDGDVLKG